MYDFLYFDAVFDSVHVCTAPPAHNPQGSLNHATWQQTEPRKDIFIIKSFQSKSILKIANFFS